MLSAYWISPAGNVTGIEGRHINEIAMYPQKFGFTRACLEVIFRKHRETYGSEGNAREEILIKLMEKGWIRVRYVERQDFYTVQLSNAFYRDESWKTLVTKWARWMVKQFRVRTTAAVNFLNLAAGLIYPEKMLYEIAGAEFLNPKKRRRK